MRRIRIHIMITVLMFASTSVLAQSNRTGFLQTLDSLVGDSRYDEALSVIASYSAANPEFDAVIANRKAEVLIGKGSFDEAEGVLAEIMQKIERLPDAALTRAMTTANMGFLDLNRGRTDRALERLNSAVQSLQQLDDPLATANALSYLGIAYTTTGKYVQAIEQLQVALALRREVLPEVHELIAASYNNLGLASLQLDVDQSLDYYEMALAIYEQMHGASHPKMAITNTNLGVAYLAQELYGVAITHFEEALSIWEKIYTQAHPSKALVLINLGRTYARMGDENAALGYYQRALDMYLAVHGTKHPDIAYAYNLIGNILINQDKFKEALLNYQRAMIANVSDFNTEAIETNPTGKNYYNGNVLLYALMYKAQALEARHLRKTLKFSDLKKALNALSICDSLIDQLRQHTTNEADKIALGEIANEVYADGVRIAYTMSEIGFVKKPYRELAFYFAEKSKSAVLLDAISDSDAKSFANIPQDLLEEEKSLKAALALTAQKLAEKPSGEEEGYLRQTAFTLSQSYQQFIKRLEQEYPQYYDLKFNTTSPSIIELQQVLTPDAALISYFIDGKNNRLYTFFITADDFFIDEHGLPENMDRMFSAFRNSIYFRDWNIYRTIAYDLYREVMPVKIPRHITKLIIIPTGRMGVMPFEALLTSDTDQETGSYTNLPYLINSYSVRYEFSAGLLLQKTSTEVHEAQSPSILLCAPVEFGAQPGLAALPGTEQEIARIAELFSGRRMQSEIALRLDATEEKLKQHDLSKFGIVHFATHGIVDETAPELSRIYLLTNSDAEDGELFSGEIYNLELNASLVTLSACQTGLGKISRGEGVIGLSRALIYAGAESIIVTYWSVADQSTADLMTDFYSIFLENFRRENKPEALRRAKLNMIRQGVYSEPYFWAPFALIGI